MQGTQQLVTTAGLDDPLNLPVPHTGIGELTDPTDEVWHHDIAAGLQMCPRHGLRDGAHQLTGLGESVLPSADQPGDLVNIEVAHARVPIGVQLRDR